MTALTTPPQPAPTYTTRINVAERLADQAYRNYAGYPSNINEWDIQPLFMRWGIINGLFISYSDYAPDAEQVLADLLSGKVFPKMTYEEVRDADRKRLWRVEWFIEKMVARVIEEAKINGETKKILSRRAAEQYNANLAYQQREERLARLPFFERMVARIFGK